MDGVTKMETKDYGVIGAIVLSILAVGGTFLTDFTQEEQENMYVCLANNETGIFYGGVSSSGLTAYPYAENRSDYVRCYNNDGSASEWIPIDEYLADVGLNINETSIVDVNSTLPVNEQPVNESDIVFGAYKIKQIDESKVVAEKDGLNVEYVRTQEESTPTKFNVKFGDNTFICEGVDNGNCLPREE